MLLLLLPLLASLLPGSDNEVGFKEPVSFYVMQTSYFHNRSRAQVLGSAWLGELETHRWESNSHTITYLWPWSRVRPKAWLSTGSSPGSGHLLLVCHVSGFYPKPVWVKWMRGEQEQPSAQQHDILPQADRTWYLRVTLDVMAEQADGLSCWVKHSSLRDQDIIRYWEHSSPTGFIFLAVTVLVLALPAGLAVWFRKRWMNRDPPSTLLPLQQKPSCLDLEHS